MSRATMPGSFKAVVLLAIAMSTIKGGRSEVKRVNWTTEGVLMYRSNPLRTKLGDTLVLTCFNTSNLFIQLDQVQYDTCNASAGSGRYKFSGYCTPNGVLMLTLTENSIVLNNAVNFVNNTMYYISSYSNGTIGTANHDWINSGGQCKEGLKMTFVIGEVSTVVLDDTVIDNNNIMTSHPIQEGLSGTINTVLSKTLTVICFIVFIGLIFFM